MLVLVSASRVKIIVYFALCESMSCIIALTCTSGAALTCVFD